MAAVRSLVEAHRRQEEEHHTRSAHGALHKDRPLGLAVALHWEVDILVPGADKNLGAARSMPAVDILGQEVDSRSLEADSPSWAEDNASLAEGSPQLVAEALRLAVAPSSQMEAGDSQSSRTVCSRHRSRGRDRWAVAPDPRTQRSRDHTAAVAGYDSHGNRGLEVAPTEGHIAAESSSRVVVVHVLAEVDRKGKRADRNRRATARNQVEAGEPCLPPGYPKCYAEPRQIVPLVW